MMRPQDKQTTNTTPAKPLTPSVSANLRPSKGPLTPKLASSYSSQPQRKHGRSGSNAPEFSSPPNISTSTPTLLSTNVTPRSGPRTSRRDGISSPSETSPSASNVVPRSLPNHSPDGGQPDPNLKDGHRSLRARNTGNGTLSPASTSRPGSPSGNVTNGPMFFHASHASFSEAETKATFPAKSPPPSNPVSQASYRAAESNQPGDNSQRPGSLGKRPGSERGLGLPKGPELSPSVQNGQMSRALPREPAVTEQGHRRKTSQSTRPYDSKVPSSPHSGATRGYTPLSLQSPPQITHSRSASTETSQAARQINAPSTNPTNHPASPAGDQTSTANSASPALSPQPEGNISFPPADILHPFPRSPSPSKDGPQPNQGVYKMSETSSSARHERKVLDLEISNSSLLAINRTLEREMRKQSAELRRFRRLSRSGRLSMTPSARSVSGGLSVVSETDDSPENFSPAGAPEEFSDSDDDLSSISDEGSMSTNSVAEDDPRPHARDEKRFLHDLSKHQQLLIDSQNMNQTIKRCLGFTENLILEAKKALEFNVHVNDVEIGGRVLSHDDVTDERNGGKGLLSPISDLPPLPDTNDVFELLSPTSGEEESAEDGTITFESPQN